MLVISTDDFHRSDVSRLDNSWNVSIRILFNVSRNTYRCLIEPISSCLHIKTLLANTFVAYFEKMNCRDESSIRLLYSLF